MCFSTGVPRVHILKCGSCKSEVQELSVRSQAQLCRFRTTTALTHSPCCASQGHAISLTTARSPAGFHNELPGGSYLSPVLLLLLVKISWSRSWSLSARFRSRWSCRFKSFNCWWGNKGDWETEFTKAQSHKLFWIPKLSTEQAQTSKISKGRSSVLQGYLPHRIGLPWYAGPMSGCDLKTPSGVAGQDCDAYRERTHSVPPFLHLPPKWLYSILKQEMPVKNCWDWDHDPNT